MAGPFAKTAPRSPVDETREALDRSREETKQAWDVFDAAREELVKSDVDLSKPSPELTELGRLEAAYRKLADEQEVLVEQWETSLKVFGAGVRQNGNGNGGTPSLPAGDLPGAPLGKSLGESFLKGIGAYAPEGLKAALGSTSAGALVPAYFDPRILPLAMQALFVRSLIPTTSITAPKVQYVRESSFTNAADVVPEHGQKPKSVISVERMEVDVVTIAHVSEALSRELLLDYEALARFVDQRLRLGVLQREEQEILVGDGPPGFTGIMNTVGINAVGPPGAGETPADVVYKGIAAVRADFYEPTGIVLNPADFAAIRLSKDANENYIAASIVSDDPSRLWGIRVVTSPTITAGTALVGDFTQAHIWDREKARVSFAETGLSDTAGQEMFSKDEVRFRGEERLAFAVLAAPAFATCDLAV